MKVLTIPMLPGWGNSQAGNSLLVREKKQVLIGMIFWGLLSILLAYEDYQTLRGVTVFYFFLLLRLGFSLVTMIIILQIIVFVNQQKEFTRIVFLWSSLAVLVPLVIQEMRPIPDPSRYLIDLITLFSLYLFIPGTLLVRAIPSLLFTIYDLAQMLMHRTNYSQQMINAAVLSFAVANGIGLLLVILSSSRQHRDNLERIKVDAIQNDLIHLASTDSLTGLNNRRRLLEIASDTFNRFLRYKRRFSVVVMDLDGFKQVNDTFGHQQGDNTLTEFARMLSSEKRETDALGRMGGDEFCLILPETNYAEAAALGERILKKCASLTLNQNKALSFSVTVSIGISEVSDQDKSVDYIFSRADTALYNAKNSGKNRCVIVYRSQLMLEEIHAVQL